MKATETFRDRVAKVIYSSSNQAFTFSLYSPTLSSDTKYLTLYKVSGVTDANSVYNINGQTELLASQFTKTETTT